MRASTRRPKATRQTGPTPPAKAGPTLSGQHPDAHPVIQLQRAIGNRAVQRLLQATSESVEVEPGVQEGAGPVHNSGRNPLPPEAPGAIDPQRQHSPPPRPSTGIQRSPRTTAASAARLEDRSPLASLRALQLERRLGPGVPLSGEQARNVMGVSAETLAGVRIHTDSAAGEAASLFGASALATDGHILFARGAFAPGTPDGRGLLRHELTHAAQQRNVAARPSLGGPVSEPGGPAELEAQASAPAFGFAAPLQRVAPGVIQCSPASEFVSAHTSWANLDERQAGADLLQRALRGDYDFVREVFGELSWGDRDDVAYEFVHAATETQLDGLAASQGGGGVLDLVYDELTAGSVSSEEQLEADRVLAAKGRRVSPEEFAAAFQTGKVFPFRLPGLTVLSDAPIMAERRPRNRVFVRMPVRVLGTAEFRGETRTLPDAVFIGGIELPEHEIVGVRMYDLGGEIVYRPALWLVGLSNQTTTTIVEKIGEVTALGLTLGTGALVRAGAGTLAQVVLWVDRVAFAVGTITSILREHRGWIIQHYGDSGREFVRYVDVVNSAVAIYGVARTAVGLGQLVHGLRRSYVAWRQAAGSAEGLSSTQAGVVRSLEQNTEQLLDDMDRLRARPAARGDADAARPPASAEVSPAEPAPAGPGRTPETPPERAPSEPAAPAAAGPSGSYTPTQAELEGYADRAWRLLGGNGPRPAVRQTPLPPDRGGQYRSNPPTIEIGTGVSSPGSAVEIVWHEASHGRIRQLISFMNEHLGHSWQRTLLRPLDEIVSYFIGGLGRVIQGPTFGSRLYGVLGMVGAPFSALGSMANATERALWAAHMVALAAAIIWAEVKILLALRESRASRTPSPTPAP